MTRSPPVRPGPQDAPDLWRGLAYQRIVTLLAWLALDADEVIFLELGEDYLAARGGAGDAVQVRHTKKPISLDGPYAHKIIQAAWDREEGIRTVYWTTSGAARERALVRDYQTPGVELWERAAEGDDQVLEALRAHLIRRRGWSASLSEALARSTPDRLRATLFRRLRWQYNRPRAVLLEARAKSQMIDRLRPRFDAPAQLVTHFLPVCLDLIDKAAQRSAEERYLDLAGLEVAIETALATQRNMATLTAPVTQAAPQTTLRATILSLDLLQQKHGALGHTILEAARDAMVHGRLRGAVALLEPLLTDEDLDPSHRAAACRLCADAELILGQTERASQLEALASECDGLVDERLAIRILSVRDLPAALARSKAAANVDPWITVELLLKCGQGLEAEELVATLGDGVTPRERMLRAFVLAANGELASAQTRLDELLATTDDLEVRQAAAAMHFIAAQATGVTVAVGRWPMPTHSALVRQTAAARQHLRQAADLFGEVAAALDDDRARKDRLVWKLACVVDLPSGRREADALLCAALEGEAPHAGAVHWGLARGLTFVHRDIESRLIGRLTADIDPDELVAAATLMVHRGADEEAVRLLERHRLCLGPDEQEGVSDWIARLKGEAEDPADLSGAVVLGQSKDDWRSLEHAAADDSAVTRRFMAVQLLALNSRWRTVAKHVEFLTSLRTPEALSLAVFALHNVERAATEVLELLAEHAEVFGPDGLPDDIVAIQVQSLSRAGRVKEAFALLEPWSPRQAEPSARMLEIGAHLNLGDLERVTVDVNSGRARGLPEGFRLQVASRIARLAPDVARGLLTDVDFSKVPISLAPLAFTMAQRLELAPDQRATISRRMFGGEAEAAGLVAKFTLEDLQAHIDAQDDGGPQRDPYEIGDQPLHRHEAEDLGREFGRLLTGEGPLPRLLTRDAAALQPEPIGRTVLRLDVLAVLTAHGLGIIDMLYQAYERVEISLRVPLALQAIEAGLQDHRTDRLEAAAAVIRALDGEAVRSSPSPDGALTVTTDPDAKTSIGGLIAGLARAGRISAARLAELDAKSGAGAPKGKKPVRAGASAVVDAEVLVLLAEWGCLDAAAETFHLYADPALKGRLQRQIDRVRLDQRIASQVTALRRRIVTDLRDGPLTATPLGSGDDDKAPPVLASLRELRAPGEAVIWTEDRSVHLRRPLSGFKIVEAFDVLADLRQRGHIDAATYGECRRCLRDAGFRFHPTSPNEVLEVLRAATIEGGEVIETAELAAMRRAFAEDLRNEDCLRLATDPEGKTVESRFLLRAVRLADDVIREIWNRKDDLRTKRAWSGWALRAFRCDQLDRAPFVQPDEAGRRVIFESGLTYRMDFGLTAGRTRKDREALYGWMWRQVIAPELEADARLKQALPRNFAEFWKAPFMKPNGTPMRETAARRSSRADLCFSALVEMPERLRDFLLSEDLRGFLGTRLGRRLMFGSLTLKADIVLPVVSAVWRYKGVKTVVSDDTRYKLTATPEGVEVREVGKRRRFLFSGDLLGAIAGSLEERTVSLRATLEPLDITDPDALAAEIAGIEDSYDRLVRLSDVQESTVPGKLGELATRLRQDRLAVEMLVPPPPEAFQRWLRCDASGQINVAALRRERPDRWIDRLEGVPTNAWSEFARLEPDATAQQLAIDPHARSPIGQLAALSLAAATGEADHVRSLTFGLLDRFKSDGEAFVDLVRLFLETADHDPAWREADEHLRTKSMWSWADLVWRTAAECGRDPAHLAPYWRKVKGPRPRTLIVRAAARSALAAPWISADRLLLAGLAFALGSRREEIWSDEVGRAVSTYLSESSAANGAPILGTLSLASDAETTWLATATEFLWPKAQDEMDQSIKSTLETYPPEDETALTILVLAGPDLLSAEVAKALIGKIAMVGPAPNEAARWGRDLQFVRQAVQSLIRRDAFEESDRDTVLSMLEGMFVSLAKTKEWSKLREGVLSHVAEIASHLPTPDLATFLGRLFDVAAPADRKRIEQITEVFLAAMPLENRVPIWREHLRMRAVR